MSTLFLIGNGFDLNCGMNTKYTDVYKQYVEKEATTENLRKFKKTISADIANWGDFEVAMARYARTLEKEQNFLECIRDFSEYMEAYLENEVREFKKRVSDEQVLTTVAQEMRNSFASFYKGISHNVDRIMEKRNASVVYNIEFVSFNYTDAFDYILSQCCMHWGIPQRNVIHIHGVLGDGPVIGIDNVEQIKTIFKLSSKGERGFVKPIFNELYDSGRVQQAKTLINDAKTICVYGMSLGESDLSWRNALIGWLKANENNHLFVYQYELADASYGTVMERMDTEEDEKYKLFQKWGIDMDSSIFEQVHIPCGKNIFNIGEVIKKVNHQIHVKQIKELANKIQQGEEWVNNHLQEVAITEEV